MKLTNLPVLPTFIVINSGFEPIFVKKSICLFCIKKIML